MNFKKNILKFFVLLIALAGNGKHFVLRNKKIQIKTKSQTRIIL